MKVLRTPDACFEGLADCPFASHCTVTRRDDGSELRSHHLDFMRST
jgi:haloalkane dehalogenase